MTDCNAPVLANGALGQRFPEAIQPVQTPFQSLEPLIGALSGCNQNGHDCYTDTQDTH